MAACSDFNGASIERDHEKVCFGYKAMSWGTLYLVRL